MKADFEGYASKAGLRCADGRTILAHAFKANDGQKVPLVWNHDRNNPDMVLGHAILEDRADGTYVYGFFNDTPKGKTTKAIVHAGNIDSLSVWANELVQRGNDVLHGVIREVSLCLAGANPGARITNVSIAHGLGNIEERDDEAVITTGESLTMTHATNDTNNTSDSEEDGPTIQDIYNSMTDDQKRVNAYMVQSAVEEALEERDDEDDSDDEDDEDDDKKSDSKDSKNSNNDENIKHSDSDNNEENEMPNVTHSVFDQNKSAEASKNELTHAQIETIFADAQKPGKTLKDSFLQHAGDYGIDNIEVLFPDAKTIENSPSFISRRMEWVNDVLSGTKHSPFSRIKSVHADITAEEARAKGYITGTKKKEEVFPLLRRITTPKTIYKKQKLDRDDILDITDLDVIAWVKAEMRVMLDEELARAILIGDGRDALNPDKVSDPAGATEGAGIRSILHDDDLYAHQVTLGEGVSVEDQIEGLVRARAAYKGSGQPVFYTTLPKLTDMLLLKDKMGRRIYETIDSLASALLASRIVTVEPMEEIEDLVGIYVNLADYTIGADKGGQVTMFEDFDIDFNQEKRLLETRVSGALTKPKSAVVVKRALGVLVNPVAPSFDGENGVITVPTIEGVEYSIEGEVFTDSLTITETTQVDANPAPGYSFPSGIMTHWVFTPTP